MIEALQKEIQSHGDRAAIVPIYRLQNLRQDLEALKKREALNKFQQYILSGIFSLDTPDTGFEVRSIIMVASPGPVKVNLLFHWQGKSIATAVPGGYTRKISSTAQVKQYLNAFLKPRGYQVEYAPKLPHKLLAVRSGLARYGRNNISFVDGLGSFHNLNPFFSDLPYAKNDWDEGPIDDALSISWDESFWDNPVRDSWQEIQQMDACRNCQACFKVCPTRAILPNRFLIDNERCLTYFNEAGKEYNFPDWINPSAHHTIYGCLRCQVNCPVDKPFLGHVAGPVEFSEEETAMIMEYRPFEQFPESLPQKVTALEMNEYLGAMPRNLKALIRQMA